MKKLKLTLFFIIATGFLLSAILYSAKAANPRVFTPLSGGTGTSTIQANNIFFGSSGGLFFTQDGDFSYATTTDTLTITNASTTNMTISTWLNSSTDRLPNAYFTNLDSTNATIGTLTLTSQMASGDLLVNGQGKFGTTATTTISGNNGTSAFSGRLTVDSTTATSTFSTGGLTVGTSQFVVQQTSGNVGIGTTSPGSLFEVYSSPNTVFSVNTLGHLTAGSLTLSQIGGENAIPLRIINLATGQNIIYARAATGQTANVLNIVDANDNPYLVVNNTGNVGIGTTSPAEQLSISNRLFVGGTGTSTIQNNLYVMGTLRAAVSYVGDLIFSNLFKFTEDIKNGLNRLVLKNQKGQEIWSIDELGKMQVKKICIEEICIDKNQLRKLLNEK